MSHESHPVKELSQLDAQSKQEYVQEKYKKYEGMKDDVKEDNPFRQLLDFPARFAGFAAAHD